MKYNGKYRIKSARLENFDYRSPGAYFVTFNTKHFKCLFGRISDATMDYSPAGLVAKNFWEEIPEHFKHVQLDEYV